MPRAKKSSQYTVIIAVVLLIIVGLGYYQYTKTDDNNIPTSAVITIRFLDGTTKTFDSNTMALGALYNPQTNSPVSSITTTIKIKPVVQASDGSYPTTLPSGYSLISKSVSNVGIMTAIEGDSEFSYWKDLTKAIPTNSALTPNTDNVILSGTISASELDSLPRVASLSSGSTVKVAYKLDSLSDTTKVALIKPDGTVTELTAGTSTARFLYDSLLVLKKSSTGATTAYTLQGVTISGGFS